MKVAIRVDASAEIGTGHVKRCLSLAHALRERGAAVRFVARDLGVDLAAQWRADGFDGLTLGAPQGAPRLDGGPAHAVWAGVDWRTDATQIIDALRNDRPQWIIVDHYAFDARWHAAVAQALGCRIAVIDDLADRELAGDVLIDPNYANDHRAKYGSRLPPSVPLLGGPRYALLGPAYATAPRHAVADTVRSIGVFMGGVDRECYSALALQAVDAVGFGGTVEVATTSANPRLAALQQAASRRADTRVSVDLPDLAAFFARHDLQVGAGGGATWERCCIGAPTLAVIVADNQRRVLEPLVGLDVLRVVDSVPPTVEAFADGLRILIENSSLRHRLAGQARRLVDGVGAGHVAEHLIHACIRSTSSAPTPPTR